MDEELPLFDIEVRQLERHWVAQARLYFTAALKLAEARRQWERAKADHEVTVAELDQDIRINPAKFGVDKVTEPRIEHLIRLQREHRRSWGLVIDARHAYDVAQAEVDTLDQKKKALENLVQLCRGEMFAEPHLPVRVDEAVREEMKRHMREAAFAPRRGLDAPKLTEARKIGEER